MTDTPADVERMYRMLLLQRSGEERLRMSCSMYAAARATVRAAVLEANPAASDADLRGEIFLRFYAADFDPATRYRIARAIARGADPGPCVVPVDWDQLEVALTFRGPEMQSYLDLRTGAVHGVSWPTPDPQWEMSEDDVERGQAEGWLVRIQPLSSADEYRWMTAFAASIGDSRLRQRLEDSLRGKGAFGRFERALADRRVCERWFAFHEARLHEAAREWLADHGIVPATEPRARKEPKP